MKVLTTLIAMTLLTSSAFAESMYSPDLKWAEGGALVKHDDRNFADVVIKGPAAKTLYFAMKVAPMNTRDHITQLPVETKEIGSTICDRKMQKDSTVVYECGIYVELESSQN